MNYRVEGTHHKPEECEKKHGRLSSLEFRLSYDPDTCEKEAKSYDRGHGSYPVDVLK
jgi:hypothetical protein